MYKSFLQKAVAIFIILVVLATYIYAAVIIESPFFKAGIIIIAFFVVSKLIEFTHLKDEIVCLNKIITACKQENAELKKRLKKYEETTDDDITQYFDE